jgi:hypothetical protein
MKPPNGRDNVLPARNGIPLLKLLTIIRRL